MESSEKNTDSQKTIVLQIVIEKVLKMCSRDRSFHETFSKDLGVDEDYKLWLQQGNHMDKNIRQRIEYILYKWEECEGLDATALALFNKLKTLSKANKSYKTLIDTLERDVFNQGGLTVNGEGRQEFSGGEEDVAKTSRLAEGHTRMIEIEGDRERETQRLTEDEPPDDKQRKKSLNCFLSQRLIMMAGAFVSVVSVIAHVLISLYITACPNSDSPSTDVTNCTTFEVLLLINGENRLIQNLDSIELFILPNKCEYQKKFPQLDTIVSNPVAELRNNNMVLACGGCESRADCGDGKRCHVLDLQQKNKHWTEYKSLLKSRTNSASFQLRGVIFVDGGASDDVKTSMATESLEFLDEGQWHLKEKSGRPRTQHCITKVGERVFSTGGKPDGRDISYFDDDPEDFKWKKLGQFDNKRYDHSCTAFGTPEHPLILVEGGNTDNGKCAKTEIYDVFRNKTYELDIEHRHCRKGATLNHVNGRIYLVGGIVTTGDESYYAKDIFEFDMEYWESNQAVNWILVPNVKLENGRSGHASVVIPLKFLYYK